MTEPVSFEEFKKKKGKGPTHMDPDAPASIEIKIWLDDQGNLDYFGVGADAEVTNERLTYYFLKTLAVSGDLDIPDQEVRAEITEDTVLMAAKLNAQGTWMQVFNPKFLGTGWKSWWWYIKRVMTFTWWNLRHSFVIVKPEKKDNNE